MRQSPKTWALVFKSLGKNTETMLYLNSNNIYSKRGRSSNNCNSFAQLLSLFAFLTCFCWITLFTLFLHSNYSFVLSLMAATICSRLGRSLGFELGWHKRRRPVLQIGGNWKGWNQMTENLMRGVDFSFSTVVVCKKKYSTKISPLNIKIVIFCIITNHLLRVKSPPIWRGSSSSCCDFGRDRPLASSPAQKWMVEIPQTFKEKSKLFSNC